jgi:MFS family permease
VTRKTSFHWAWIILAYLFSYIILTPITGYLTDRFGARYVIKICTCILGAILVHWVSGVLRDSTGSYDYSFAINTVMAAMAVLLICTVKKNTMSTRYLGECQKG